MLKRDPASRRDEEPVGAGVGAGGDVAAGGGVAAELVVVAAAVVVVVAVVVGVVAVGEGACASFSRRQSPGPWTGDP